MSKRVLTIVGARPQFIKAAALSRAIAADGRLDEILVHTGQHYDPAMSDVFFEELGIPRPSFHLGVHGGSHGAMTARMLQSIEELLLEATPEWVIVYGDTNSTLAGALAAAKLHIPVAHVEAGLRSFNRRMPEEINRVLADHVSSLLFCPTSTAIQNLRAEGIVEGVHHTGEVMFDATLHAADLANRRSKILERLGLRVEGYALATIHRAENTDDIVQLSKIIDWLRTQAGKHPVVLPIHPRTRQAVERGNLSLDGLVVIEPVGYLDMHRLLSSAIAVYTDSGGVQKEAYFHRRPCVTLRTETEWTETIEHGWNRLWTVSQYKPRRDIHEYGKGRAADVISKLLAENI